MILLVLNFFALILVAIKLEQRTRALFELDNDDVGYNDWEFNR